MAHLGAVSAWCGRDGLISASRVSTAASAPGGLACAHPLALRSKASLAREPQAQGPGVIAKDAAQRAEEPAHTLSPLPPGDPGPGVHCLDSSAGEGELPRA